jgi:uncharacterized damage-inducible protein DinB
LTDHEPAPSFSFRFRTRYPRSARNRILPPARSSSTSAGKLPGRADVPTIQTTDTSMRRILPVLMLLLVPAAAGAQATSDPFMTSSKQLYETGKRYVVTTAEQMPAEDFVYRPVATVRTLGQILGHLADVHFITCSIGLGEENPNPSSIEQSNPGKDELIEAMRRSYALCDRAYAQGDAALTAPAELFGQQTTRFHALNLNVSHDFEHYGNLVTYMRMRDRVPPSSQPAQ